MAHARKQIRDAIKAKLLGLPITGARVYTGRARPLGDGDPPSLVISSPKETSSRSTYARPPKLERPLTLYVEGRLTGTSDDAIDDNLDAIAEQVEPALAADITLGDLLLNMQLITTEIVINASGTATGVAAGIRLEYRLTYTTIEGAPGVIVD